jgi:hypothetical protein
MEINVAGPVCSSVLKALASMCEALGSISSTKKKKETKISTYCLFFSTPSGSQPEFLQHSQPRFQSLYIMPHLTFLDQDTSLGPQC